MGLRGYTFPDVLYATKAVLNTDECPFKGVYVQEDLTMQRSKMLRYLKGLANVERVKTSEGKLHVSLKEDKGSDKKVTVENPDGLFRVRVWVRIDLVETATKTFRKGMKAFIRTFNQVIRFNFNVLPVNLNVSSRVHLMMLVHSGVNSSYNNSTNDTTLNYDYSNDLYYDSQDTVIYSEIKILSLNAGGLRSTLNKPEWEETVMSYCPKQVINLVINGEGSTCNIIAEYVRTQYVFISLPSTL